MLQGWGKKLYQQLEMCLNLFPDKRKRKKEKKPNAILKGLDSAHSLFITAKKNIFHTLEGKAQRKVPPHRTTQWGMPEEYRVITRLTVLKTYRRVRLLSKDSSKICARALKAFPKLQWVRMNALLYQTQGDKTVRRQVCYGTSGGIRSKAR